MSPTGYRHLLFDLDHTLWDFERNSAETLLELYHEANLHEIFVSSSEFLAVYHQINGRLWDAYGRGKVSKNKVKYDRFIQTLRVGGSDNLKLAHSLADDYVVRSPQKTHLMPGVRDLIPILCQRYQLHIITNGFNEVQFTKIRNSGLTPFFTQIITSEDAGFQKPAAAYFDYLLAQTGIQVNTSLVIGDNTITDIKGAKDFGFDTVFYNPDRKHDTVGATFEIHHMSELLQII